jgi:hypothetical protein
MNCRAVNPVCHLCLLSHIKDFLTIAGPGEIVKTVLMC